MGGNPVDLRPLYVRVEEKIQPEPNTGCWLFDGTLDKDGYGRITLSRVAGRKRRPIGAHRVIWERDHGPIPDNLTIDHKCRVRCCVNPDHMELVSAVENVMRGISLAAQNARKTHCMRGHPLSGDNLLIDGHGYRQCRQCEKERRKKANALSYRKRLECVPCA